VSNDVKGDEPPASGAQSKLTAAEKADQKVGRVELRRKKADDSVNDPEQVRDPIDDPWTREMPEGDEPLDAALPDEDLEPIERRGPDDEDVDAGLVPAGGAYPEPYVQRLQSVTSAVSRNHGGNAVDYEKEARKVDTPERDGVHELDGRKLVYYKTFRLGIPPGASLASHQHEGNMRQTVEDVLKSGERVASATTLYSVSYDKVNHQTLMTYAVDLDRMAPKADVDGDPTVATDVAPLVGRGAGDPPQEKVISSA
jgi:hypothetical protein